VLGPLHFLLYMADLFEVTAKHEARAHFYADDGQLYISARALWAEDTIRQFTDCLCLCLKYNQVTVEMIQCTTN